MPSAFDVVSFLYLIPLISIGFMGDIQYHDILFTEFQRRIEVWNINFGKKNRLYPVRCPSKSFA